MPNLTLSPSEGAVLTGAATRGDAQVILPTTMKPASAQRLLGKLLKHELVAATEQEGIISHHLTLAGYEAVGLKPPSAVPAPALPAHSRKAVPASDAPQAGTKREHVVALLSRPEGASLAELITATGWLPHTTRAALSRLRSSGRTLEKSPREDGSTAYRIVIEPARPRRRSRKPAAEARAQVSIG
ncbi:DUF3489 domain-containing protein [Methylobacterium iners]|uniref:DUF3489 domain-containing protein n=1 Tax=Methylobacterium iners TaxID=418707 RepID=A0ABQ4S7Z5_9HYPH|nr:DUF3489 domain-containing protein [Methylobacterium iners]GJD97887.1 hypothetical protein OCOJLMKI_5126 [Methylobacterium iners]